MITCKFLFPAVTEQKDIETRIRKLAPEALFHTYNPSIYQGINNYSMIVAEIEEDNFSNFVDVKVEIMMDTKKSKSCSNCKC